MKSKFIKTYVLGAVLIVALAILIVPKYIQNGKETNEPVVLFNFTETDIDKINLEYPNQETKEKQVVELQKVDNMWVVATNHNYKARQEEIITMIEKAKEIKQQELASQNPDRQKDLGIDAESGTHIKISRDNSVVADFWLGKSATQGNATYFRLDGSNLVYTTKNNIRYYFNKPDWIDKTIIKADKDKIHKINFNMDKWQTILLEKNEITNESEDKNGDEEKYIWQATKPWRFDIDDEKITNIISTLSNMRAQDVVFDTTLDETGLINSKTKISFEAEDVQHELIFGNKIDAPKTEDENDLMMGEGKIDKYYIKTGDSEQIFTVDAHIVENILSPKANDLKKTSK